MVYRVTTALYSCKQHNQVGQERLDMKRASVGTGSRPSGRRNVAPNHRAVMNGVNRGGAQIEQAGTIISGLRRSTRASTVRCQVPFSGLCTGRLFLPWDRCVWYPGHPLFGTCPWPKQTGQRFTCCAWASALRDRWDNDTSSGGYG